MDPFRYQKLAQRTECNQHKTAMRIGEQGLEAIRLMHGAIGLAGDAGEVCAAIERYIWYGKDLDRLNVVEELGDCLWYIAEICNALDIDMSNVMATNIGKLKQRYPEKFDYDLAAEEHRDREAEREVMASSCSTIGGCKTCGTDERVAEGDGVPPGLKQLCSGHNCPSCHNHVSDEVVKRLYLGKTVEEGCPNCRGRFVLRILGGTYTKLVLESLEK